MMPTSTPMPTSGKRCWRRMRREVQTAPHSKTLKQSQLDSDNPYNTRKFAGLPPGPISTVIGDAMDAVLNYEKSDDLFFFADENGKVHFFKTQDDFSKGIEDIGLLKDDPETTEGE